MPSIPVIVNEHAAITTPFFQACEELAQDYVEQHGRNTESLSKKEHELLKLRAQLSNCRAELENTENQLSSVAAVKQGEAPVDHLLKQSETYARLFNLAARRDELEQQVWELECTLAKIYKILAS